MRPVALSFVNRPPSGIDIIRTDVPSSYLLWRKAEEGVFAAPAEVHFSCPVGAMVMGFELAFIVNMTICVFSTSKFEPDGATPGSRPC